jgi:hypothetical protein
VPCLLAGEALHEGAIELADARTRTAVAAVLVAVGLERIADRGGRLAAGTPRVPNAGKTAVAGAAAVGSLEAEPNLLAAHRAGAGLFGVERAAGRTLGIVDLFDVRSRVLSVGRLLILLGVGLSVLLGVGAAVVATAAFSGDRAGFAALAASVAAVDRGRGIGIGATAVNEHAIGERDEKKKTQGLSHTQILRPVFYRLEAFESARFCAGKKKGCLAPSEVAGSYPTP